MASAIPSGTMNGLTVRLFAVLLSRKADLDLALTALAKKDVCPERVARLRAKADVAVVAFGRRQELEAVRQTIEELDLEIGRLAETARPLLKDYINTLYVHPDSKFIFEFARVWAQNAFPKAIVGHKLAASFMATAIESHMLEHVTSPWPAWQAIVPNGLVSVINNAGQEEDIERVLVLTDGYAWHVCAVARSTQMWRRGPLEDLTGKDAGDPSLFSKAPDERDERAWIMLIRYIVGVCFELGDPTVMGSAMAQKHRGERKREPGALPSVWKFELRRDIKVDTREAVRRYVAGGGGAPSVQVLVCGHWKRQACGVGRAERRVIHIAPYWRGPEDAPIAVRAHRMGDP